MILALPDLKQAITEEIRPDFLHALFRDLTILAGSSCLQDVYLGKSTVARNIIPKQIAIPLDEVAKKLGYRPWVDYYTSTVMGNFQVIDPTQEISIDNLNVIRSMSGMDAESGFFLVHVTISAKTKTVVKCIEEAFNALEANDTATFLVKLQTINSALTEAK